ncbi:ATP-dependent DNA helicase [Kiloniella laminariae]|uniref:ATP-dependent DNA helicase n=1 Tax=Kiloniella laminariae TaxID=454162 RepID=A0ABT4LMC8_9PROT|nr:ATP-dependent DNA helicase [Kiloniella laminariae]MCZ4282216.1 ATP-dependent DNA helicase [Kiloniella laminariae]
MTADHDTPAPQATGTAAGLMMPKAPLLLSGMRFSVWISPDGEIERLANSDVAKRITLEPPFVCHARATAQRLGVEPFLAYDVLELIAFVRPTAACTPTPRGLAAFIGAPEPASIEAATLLLYQTAELLLREQASRGRSFDPYAADVARTMMMGGWLWGPAVLAAMGEQDLHSPASRPGRGLNVWERLEEWSDHAPEDPPRQLSVSAEESRNRLAELLGEEAESRPQQADYASAVASAFAPRNVAGEPNILLAEAGTGVGKTLGYIAPASVWAEKNGAPVWISTYTRNLQTQIDSELDRLFPERYDKAKRVVIRKGRENYLCLLNLAEATQALTARPNDAIAIGLMTRWAGRSRNGDMVGGDFPGWLSDLVGRSRTTGLTDRRGECIYSACPHYSRCYIERNIRKAKRANIVVANHALVMVQAAMGGGRDEGNLPSHYVFDEGHHLFDAADAAFSAHLTAQESQELRRWLTGVESSTARSASRARGLKKRLEDLIATDPRTGELVTETIHAARHLTGDGWVNRLEDNLPVGPMESFLAHVRTQVYARTDPENSPYSLETETKPTVPGLIESALELKTALKELLEPIKNLRRRLEQRLDTEADELDSDTRRRIEAACKSLEQRGSNQVQAWVSMLDALEDEIPEEFTDWFSVERAGGKDLDVGLHRHWIDPTKPLANTLLTQAHGTVITSATLTEGSGSEEGDWIGAERRTGASFVPGNPIRVKFKSPYDYADQTRVFIINDVRKDDMEQVAAAYRELFLASQGGALGLFTAISRLRSVHQKIGPELDRAGLTLYSQHMDNLDTSTLIDIFRAERNSSLLGTDAVRDGVDVPGDSLRLIVFDRVPWPRPTIQHRARKEHFGGNRYNDSQTRLKLKQAYGRLVRRANDRGVFVLLDPMMPSRLQNAFPEGVSIQKIGLAETVQQIKSFFAPPAVK